MKKLFTFFALAISLAASSQVNISALPTHTGSPAGGFIPIVIGGQTKKISTSLLIGGGVTAEVDPYFTASPAAGITGTLVSHWNSAYGWGNHAGLYASLSGSYTNPSWIVSLPWSKITSTPTTISGYGISDAYPLTGNPSSFLIANQSITWTAGGDVSGSASHATTLLPSLTVTGLRGSVLPSLSTGNLKWNGSAWAFDATAYSTFSPTVSSPSTGQVLRWNGTVWANSAIQAGDLPTSNTVSSIQLTTPSVLYTTPINMVNTGGAWAGTLSLISQSANMVLASPAGSAGTPTFQQITQAYAPTLATINGNVNAQTGTTYTLVAGDNGKVVTISNASSITLTVPSGLGAGFNCLVVQLGAGQITFSASSTTLNNRQSFTKTAGQYAIATLVAYASNTFITSGDMQ
jgi:hypothetical protein